MNKDRTMTTRKAGPDLDAEVAEKVMGWTLADRKAMGWGDGPLVWRTGQEENPTQQDFRPSTDPARAWLVRVKMSELGWASQDQLTWMGWLAESARPWGYSIWFERWVDHEKVSHHAHVPNCADAPLAVSLAALQAVEAACPA